MAPKLSAAPKGQLSLLQFFTPARGTAPKPPAYSSGSQGSGSTDNGISPDKEEVDASPATSTLPALEALMAPVDWSAVAGVVLHEGLVTCDAQDSAQASFVEAGESCCAAIPDDDDDDNDDETSRDLLLGALLGLDVEDGGPSSPRASTSVRSFHFADEDDDDAPGPVLARLAQAFAPHSESRAESDADEQATRVPSPPPPLRSTAHVDTTHTVPSRPMLTSAAPPRTQTFLDFGQSSLAVGATCPSCGMLYATLDHDVAFHRRTCEALAAHRLARVHNMSDSTVRATARLMATLEKDEAPFSSTVTRKRTRAGRAVASTTSSSSAPSRLLAASAAVELLEWLTAGTETRKGARRAPPTQSSRLCQRLPRAPTAALEVYVLDGGHAEAARSAPALRLIEALGFVDVVEAALSYKLIIVVEARARRVLVAAAGRASLREQDPELLLLPRTDGTSACRTQQRFTLCDVNLVWRAPTAARVAEALAAQDDGLSAAGHKNPLHRLLHAREARQHAKDAIRAQVRRSEREALVLALTTLAQHVVYGQALHLVEQCSYASSLFRKDGAETGGHGLTCEDLCAALNAAPGVSDILASDLFQHSDDSDDSDDDDTHSDGHAGSEEGPLRGGCVRLSRHRSPSSSLCRVQEVYDSVACQDA